MTALLVAIVLFLAWSNGANDNPKGVATLVGSRTTDPRTAIVWATGTTLLGSLAAVGLGRALARAFSGRGLVPDAVTADPVFLAAVGLGAALTVALATRVGMPISTTHALTGGLVGAGWMLSPEGLTPGQLGAAFVLPLLTSPLLALILTAPLYAAARVSRRALGVREDTCLCVGSEITPVSLPFLPAGAGAAAVETHLSARTGRLEECRRYYRGSLLGFDATWLLDRAHFLSAGLVSFARGLNDAPKIAGLLLVLGAAPALGGSLGIAVAMAAGGWFASRRVTETVSFRITDMNAGQGFCANVVTAALVTGASLVGVPVSTTHVSVGALFGIGMVNGGAHGGMIATVLGAWLLTLPTAALAAAGAAALLGG